METEKKSINLLQTTETSELHQSGCMISQKTVTKQKVNWFEVFQFHFRHFTLIIDCTH